jgi:hypothetical protein
MANDTRGPREIAYDTEIAPLMKKIIAACKAHGIPMLADFALDGDMQCTTAILVDKDDPPQYFRQAYALLCPAAPSPLMVTTRDSEGRVTSMTAIV